MRLAEQLEEDLVEQAMESIKVRLSSNSDLNISEAALRSMAVQAVREATAEPDDARLFHGL